MTGPIRPARPRRPGRLARPSRLAGDAGNAALELVILTPVLILLICFVIAAGRVAIAHGSIDAAARDAARQASIARSPQDALAALAATQDKLAAEGLNCTPTIDPDDLAAAFAAPVGQLANITITVRCSVSLSDLVLKGLPGHIPLSYSFTSPLDPYRGRSTALGPAAVSPGGA
jgi:Flp pilus assembly protein TadG